MTIDDRLDRLTRRHEAMAQSLELLTQDVREIADRLKSLDGTVNKLAGFTTDIAEGTARLLRVAEIHEQRISRLEGGD